MVRYLFYTIGDLTYQSPRVQGSCLISSWSAGHEARLAGKTWYYFCWTKGWTIGDKEFKSH